MDDLYIMRHGIAVAPGTPGIPDDERPLTSKGEKRMRQVARGLRRLDLKLDRIATSPLPRAYRTAEILAEELNAVNLVEAINALRAGAAATAIQRWLRERTEDRLMVVGHNPALTDLITLLVTGDLQPQLGELKKGGIAALKPGAGAQDRYELVWMATPRLIRRLPGG